MDTKSDFHRLLWLLPIAIGSTSTALYFGKSASADFIWLIVVPFVLDSVLVALLARWLRGSRRGSR